jgi:hypothetical protein
MAPADLLLPLEGQREETLRLVDVLSWGDLERTVRGDGRTVRQLLCHLINRDHGVNYTIRLALQGEVVRLSPDEREEMTRWESDPAPAEWDLSRIRLELVDARSALRQVFAEMSEADLDRPIRWPEWPARTIRTSIPYILEHEDSHLDELRSIIPAAR